MFARAAARSALFTGVDPRAGDDVVVGSAAGFDARDTAGRATGELIERMANIVAGRAAEAEGQPIATHRELRRAGRRAVDPGLLDPRAHAAANGDEARDAVHLWVPGRSLSTGDEVLVPAAAVYLRHRPPSRCRAGGAAGSTGVAAHPDEASAIGHAAWEVLERDLIRRSWYQVETAPPVAVELRLRADLTESLAALRVTATGFLLPAPAGVACVVVCVHGPEGTGQTFGARCGPAADVSVSADKAAYEALMVRWSLDTAIARRGWDRWAGATAPRTALEHALWAFHGQDSLGLWLADARAGPASPSARAVDAGSVLAAHTGGDAIAVPTMSAQAREAGLHVVRVVAPGAFALPSGPPGAGGPPRSRRPHPFG